MATLILLTASYTDCVMYVVLVLRVVAFDEIMRILITRGKTTRFCRTQGTFCGRENDSSTQTYGKRCRSNSQTTSTIQPLCSRARLRWCLLVCAILVLAVEVPLAVCVSASVWPYKSVGLASSARHRRALECSLVVSWSVSSPHSQKCSDCAAATRHVVSNHGSG